MALNMNGHNSYAYNYSLTSKRTKPLHLSHNHALIKILLPDETAYPQFCVSPPSLSCSLSICFIYICVCGRISVQQANEILTHG